MKDYLNTPEMLIDTIFNNNQDEHQGYAMQRVITILASTLDSILIHVDSGALRKGTLEAIDNAIKA
jgi:hypothetical protein